MCYSFRASIGLGIILLFISFYLYSRNREYDRWNAMFIFGLSLIQFLEGGVWSVVKSNVSLNVLLSTLLGGVLMLQVILQSYMGWKSTSSSLLKAMTYIYLLLLIFVLIITYNTPPSSIATNIHSDGHLGWQITRVMGGLIIAYLVGLFVPLLFMGSKGRWMIGFGLLSLGIAYLLSNRGSLASVWCFYSVVYALAAIFI